MKKTLALLRKGFESSSYKTPEFLNFCKVFKKEFSEELKAIQCTDIKFHIGHFYISGFYTFKNQPYYFSISDVRFFGGEEKILYRTCKDYNDYTGGHNQYAQIKHGMCLRMI